LLFTPPNRHRAPRSPTHPHTPGTPQVILFPFGEDKDYIDEYKVYKGAINVTDLKEYVFKNIPDLTTRLESVDSISAFIHRWGPVRGLGGPSASPQQSQPHPPACCPRTAGPTSAAAPPSCTCPHTRTPKQPGPNDRLCTPV
jgi:hypothetical protein